MSDELKLGLDALRATGYSAYACAIKELVTDLRAELAAAKQRIGLLEITLGQRNVLLESCEAALSDRDETIARQAETIAELRGRLQLVGLRKLVSEHVSDLRSTANVIRRNHATSGPFKATADEIDLAAQELEDAMLAATDAKGDA